MIKIIFRIALPRFLDRQQTTLARPFGRAASWSPFLSRIFRTRYRQNPCAIGDTATVSQPFAGVPG